MYIVVVGILLTIIVVSLVFFCRGKNQNLTINIQNIGLSLEEMVSLEE
jgi:hypothetical protein